MNRARDRTLRHRQILRHEARADRPGPLGAESAVLGLLGTNGAGKTTMIKCALGLIRPQAGEARLLGEPAWTLSARQRRTSATCRRSSILFVDEDSPFARLHRGLLSQLEPRSGRPADRAMVDALGGPRRHAFGGPTPAAVDYAGAESRAGVAHFGRAGGESRSPGPAAIFADDDRPGRARRRTVLFPRTSRPTWSTWPTAWRS